MTASNTRQSDHPIDRIFLDRWSPRAFTGAPMPETDMLSILDAAHWAPSSGNSQPWRFVYALKGSDNFDKLLGFLAEGNQRWAVNASALLVLISKTYTISSAGERRAAYNHAFDTGAAWLSLALQSMSLGYHAHGMAGLDKDKAFAELNVPEGYRVEAAVAIGRIASKDTLPDDLQEREVPSKRKPLHEVAFEGSFTGTAD